MNRKRLVAAGIICVLIASVGLLFAQGAADSERLLRGQLALAKAQIKKLKHQNDRLKAEVARLKVQVNNLRNKPGAAKRGDASTQASSPEAPGGGKIVLGMTLPKARAILKQAGATDISAAVSIMPNVPPGLEVKGIWYLLGDNTCLSLRAERREGPKDEPFRITHIVLGEKGKGYPNKLKWAGQSKVVLRAVVITKTGARAAAPATKPARWPATRPVG